MNPSLSSLKSNLCPAVGLEGKGQASDFVSAVKSVGVGVVVAGAGESNGGGDAGVVDPHVPAEGLGVAGVAVGEAEDFAGGYLK